jgi:hypothetical protein
MEEFDRSKIVTMRDLRGAKMCWRGSRAWAIENNLDFDDFAKNGITCGELIDTGDAMALQAVRYVHGWK